MLPGASTIKEDIFFNILSAEGAAATEPLDFFDFFTELVNLVVHRGVTTFSALEFSSFGSFPLLNAGGLGEGNLGEMGGEREALVLGLGRGEGRGVGARGSWELFLRDFLCSKLGN